MTKFDKISCKALAQEIETALQVVAARHGLTVASAGGLFNDVEYTSKMKFTLNDPKALEANEKVDFARNCHVFGLTPDKYGKRFTTNGVTYELIGFTSRAKFPARARDVATKKIMLFSDLVFSKVA